MVGSINDTLGNISPTTAAVAAGVAGLAVGAGVGAGIVALASGGKTKKGKKRIKHTSRGWKLDRKKRSKQKWEVAYRRRKAKLKHHSKKRRGKIYYAKKTGQPYILQANGQAKFIKGRRKK